MTHPLTRDARTLLESWRAPDAVQEALRTAFLTCADQHEHPWSRDCWTAHLTASALVVAPDRSRVLLVLHSKVGRWLQTGGHIEPDDPSLAAAALREAEEESGLPGRLVSGVVQLSRHLAPCASAQEHLDVRFVVEADPNVPSTLAADADEVAWFSLDALPELEPEVGDLVRLATALPQRSA